MRLLTALILAVSLASWSVAGVKDPCADACDFKKLPEPVAPSKYDATIGLLTIAEGMFKSFAYVGGPVGTFAGNLGVGIFTGLRGGASAQATTSSWQNYNLKKDLVKMQDYLVCKMDSIVGDAIYDIKNYMAEQKLIDFNEAIWGLSSAIAEKCRAMNCLNATDISPAARDKKWVMDCAMPSPNPVPACAGTWVWDPANPKPCSYLDSSGATISGICDPDGKCYDLYGADQARAALKQILAMFTSMGAIKNFKAFSQWQDLRATVALAKGSMIKIAVLQHLVMLSDGGGYVGELQSFAKSTAAYLEERVKYHTDVDRLYLLMDSRSVGGSKDPFADVTYPQARCFYDCCLGGGWCFGGSDGWCAIQKENAVIKVNQRIRKTCTRPLKTKSLTCSLPLGFGPGGSEHKCSTVSKTCGTSECYARGPDCGLQSAAYSKCLEEWKAYLNDKSKCPITAEALKASMRAEAVNYAAIVAKELEPVTKLAKKLRKMSTMSAPAMHGAFLKRGYPAFNCDNAEPPAPAMHALSHRRK